MPRCPPTIERGVVAVIVDAIDLGSGRAIAHIFGKPLEPTFTEPAIADLDPSAAIIGVFRVGRLGAAAHHLTMDVSNFAEFKFGGGELRSGFGGHAYTPQFL